MILYNSLLIPLVRLAQKDMPAQDMGIQQLTNLAKLATTVLQIVLQLDKRIVRKDITVWNYKARAQLTHVQQEPGQIESD